MKIPNIKKWELDPEKKYVLSIEKSQGLTAEEVSDLISTLDVKDVRACLIDNIDSVALVEEK